MSKFFSFQERRIYDSETHQSMPADAAPLSDEEYNHLFDGQLRGKSIVFSTDPNDPKPKLVDRSPITDEQRAAVIKKKRELALAECDWTMLPDAQVDKVAWAAYRQALRDLTEQAGFPQSVIWPTPPSTKKAAPTVAQ